MVYPLLLARTEKAGHEDLSEETEIKVLQKLVKQRKESADIYFQQGRADLAQVELDQANVIEAYLPKQLEKEELESALKEIIAQV